MPFLNWSDDEIAEMAAVGRIAIGDAFVWWRQRAPRNSGRELDEATPDKPVDRKTLDRIIGVSAAFLVYLSRALQDRSLRLDVWQSSFADEITPLHLAMAAAAAGGMGALTLDDTGRVEQQIRMQLGYLRNFAGEIEAGTARLDGRFLRRVEMYAQAGRGTYYEETNAVMERNGFDLERSIRTARDSCPGCIEQAMKGWQPIGTIIPVGQRLCLTRCLCYMEYQSSAAGVVVRR